MNKYAYLSGRVDMRVRTWPLRRLKIYQQPFQNQTKITNGGKVP